MLWLDQNQNFFFIIFCLFFWWFTLLCSYFFLWWITCVMMYAPVCPLHPRVPFLVPVSTASFLGTLWSFHRPPPRKALIDPFIIHRQPPPLPQLKKKGLTLLMNIRSSRNCLAASNSTSPPPSPQSTADRLTVVLPFSCSDEFDDIKSLI